MANTVKKSSTNKTKEETTATTKPKKTSTSKATTKTTSKSTKSATALSALETSAPKKEISEKTVLLEEIKIEKEKNVYVASIVKETPKEETITNQVASFKRYNPDVNVGLTLADVEFREEAGLNNRVDSSSSKSILRIVFKNVFTIFNIIMFSVAGWIISVMGMENGPSWTNLLFLIVIIFNVAIGILQEIRAKNMLDRLSLLSAPTAIVIREKMETEVIIEKVVIDDILLFKSGKQIPADCVVREGSVEVNESLLTGEADAIVKEVGDTLYSGSFIVSGLCYAQATAVGKDMYINHLALQAKEYKKPRSNLLGSLRLLLISLTTIIIPVATLLFMSMSGLLHSVRETNYVYAEVVAKTAGAIVGMVPAGLFLLTSVALAVGVIKLAQNNTLVQELYCIEMLARVDTLCLDKTGTITDGTMAVRGILEYQNPSSQALKNIIPAMMDAQNDNNLTSQALIERFGVSKRIKHRNIIPFSSDRKYSAVEFEKVGTYVLGAPELVIKENYSSIARDVEKQALEGYRVLVLGFTPEKIVNNQLQGTVLPVGLIMIEDTIRPDAIDTIQYFKDYGVNVKVISGDNPMTVARIAERAGIPNASKYISLEGLSKEEVIRTAENYSVFGRVSPQQKEILVRALKNKGHIVAMTGDGVNDILALKEADTSIAMASGSEAARNVSHLVLMDSNFSSMPKVVAEGRRVINNVQKVATLFLTKTLFSLILSIIGILEQSYPIVPSQLMIIDYLVIGLPSVILVLEPNNRLAKGHFLWNIIKSAIPGALVVVLSSLIVYFMAPKEMLDLDSYATSTLIVISASFTCFMVLFRVSKPFNKRRLYLFGIMFVLFLFLIFVTPHIFNFRPFYKVENYVGDVATPLTVPHILLLIVLVQASYPVMVLIASAPAFISKSVKTMLSKLGNIEE